MKYSRWFCLIFSWSILLAGCKDDKTAIKEPEVPEVIPADSPPVPTRPTVKNPTIWHAPSVLIEQLGDVRDKTVANIGAGPYGYFSLEIADEAKKVIAIDIDPRAIRFIDSMRIQLLPAALQNNLEARLVPPDNPNLRFEEADVITIRETYPYLPNRIGYLRNLKNGLKDNGRLIIVDFKMRRLPIGPPQSEKVPLYIVEQELEAAGYKIVLVDDKSLAYQYLVVAMKR